MTRDRRIAENQGVPEYATQADLPPPADWKGLSIIQEPFTVCSSDGIRYNKLISEKLISNIYEDITPTHFFDPTATGSSGVGTYANPYTTAAQLATITSGEGYYLTNTVIGFKRGTIYRGNIELIRLSGFPGRAPLIICPYGNAVENPEIRATRLSSGWTQYSGDTRIWKKTSALNQQFYSSESSTDLKNYHRYMAVTSIANLQAAGPGYYCYVGGVHYLFPLTSNSPNLGQIEETYETVSINAPTAAFKVRYTNAANEIGNFSINGLTIRGSAGHNLEIYPDNSGPNITSVKNIVIDNCTFGWSGIDATQTLGPSGVSFSGVSNTIRLLNSKVSNCYFHDIKNNSVEIWFSDGLIVEHNDAKRIGGKSIVELFGCDSNAIIRYNRGANLKGETYQYSTAGSFSDGGVWISGYDETFNTQDRTKNVNNIIAFNYIYNCAGAGFDIGAGTAKAFNNTIVAGDMSTSQPIISYGLNSTSGKYCELELTNNVLYYEGTEAFYIAIGDGNTGNVLTGDNNLVSNPRSEVGVFYYKNVSYSTSLANWKTAIGGAQASTFCYNPSVYNGVPLASSKALGAGTTGLTGYSVDLAGNILSGNLIGAYQNEKTFF